MISRLKLQAMIAQNLPAAIAWEAVLLLLRVQPQVCCDVVVADTSDSSCSLATAGDYLPCKRWDNFYDSSKADEYKFTLSTTVCE